jgi:hypothetical protein
MILQPVSGVMLVLGAAGFALCFAMSRCAVQETPNMKNIGSVQELVDELVCAWPTAVHGAVQHTGSYLCCSHLNSCSSPLSIHKPVLGCFGCYSVISCGACTSSSAQMCAPQYTQG